MKLLARQVYVVGMDLLFPPLCVSCGRVGSLFCRRCEAKISRATERSVAGLDEVLVFGDFEGTLRDAIHALKYLDERRVAHFLGPILAEAIQHECGEHWNIDCVVAVPLHTKRLAERGYNQCALLADEVGRILERTVRHDCLVRRRETESQVNLSAQERLANVTGAFAVRGDDLDGRRVLVIDDVLTTGATLAACADVLRNAGAVAVYGATVAGATLGPK